ncbi:MAG: class I SAM-dependent methyltransferase [Pirellulales bacterium]
MSLYPETEFGGFTRCNGTVAFYTRIDALLRPTDVVLDVGCGRGAHSEHPVDYIRRLRDFRGRCRAVWGCDVDAVGEQNPTIAQFFRINESGWDVPDAEIDLAIADCVLEHVPDPDLFFREAARVVRPGGYLCIRTPNALGYVSLAARVVPNRLHGRVVRLVAGRNEADTFPTLYRCNTARRLHRALEQAGFKSAVYRHEPEPSYLGKGAAFRIGARLNAFIPAPLRNVLLAFGRRV